MDSFSQADGNDSLKQMRQQLQDDVVCFKEMRQQLQDRIESRRVDQQHLFSSLQSLVPDLVSSLDLSLKIVSAFNGRTYTPENPNPKTPPENSITPRRDPRPVSKNPSKPPSDLPQQTPRSNDGEDEDGSAGDSLSVVRSMVAVCLLERVPFKGVDSAALLRKVEADPSATPAEKAALLELGGEAGAIAAVEIALKAIAESTGAVELEDFGLSGKSRVLVLGINRNLLVKELPESSQLPQTPTPERPSSTYGNQIQPPSSAGIEMNGAVYGMGGSMQRPPQPQPQPQPPPEMWLGPVDPHMSGLPQMFPPAGGPGPMMGPRGGPRVMGLMGIPRVMGAPPLHRPPLGPSPNAITLKPSTEDDDMKDVEALLNKKSFREMQQSKTGEELHDLIHRPTARETRAAEKVCAFRTF